MTGDNHYAVMKYLGIANDDNGDKWIYRNEYFEKYDAWNIGGESIAPIDEGDWADDWIQILTYGDAHDKLPENSYASIYGAIDEAGLYEKHAPIESNGPIQSLIDEQCEQEENQYIWTDYKVQLCTHKWDWYENGYYGPDIQLITTTVQDVLGQEIYDPETDTWQVDPNAVTESYEETRLLYVYDGDDPDQDLLRNRRWAPNYCLDWHKTVEKSTIPEDMEFFLKKCKYTLLDEPEENPNKVVGDSRMSLYEKVSESYCEHLECGSIGIGKELCPNGLDANDGTGQSIRRKSGKTWNPVTQTWDLRTNRPLCFSEATVELDNLLCGSTPADKAHCNDDCNTMPYCSLDDYGTIYCTQEYWTALKQQCSKETLVRVDKIKEILSSRDDLTAINYAKMFQKSNLAATKDFLKSHFKQIKGVYPKSVELDSPGTAGSSYDVELP